MKKSLLVTAILGGLPGHVCLAQERIDLRGLNGSNGFVIVGANIDDRAGRAVSGAGDFNGDGISDLIIGARFADTNNSNAGESYVVFGQSGSFPASFSLATLNGLNGMAISGIDENDSSGLRVAGGGDLNGDGLSDVVIGAPNADQAGSGEGESYVVFGTSTPSASTNLSDLDGATGFVVPGINPADTSGRGLNLSHDINGDGFSDLVIGAYQADAPTNNEGQSYVVFGQSSAFAASVDLATLNGANGFTINGIDSNDFSGRSVSSSADINGDGFAEILIGARFAEQQLQDEGEAYVIFGFDNSLISQVDLIGLNGSNGFAVVGDQQNGFLGNAVSPAGDMNGDGLADIAVGANGQDGGLGNVLVVFGSTNPFPVSLRADDLDGNNGFRIIGSDAVVEAGYAVSAAGDVNGDGLDDQIVNSGGFGASERYLIFGSNGGFPATLKLADLSGPDGLSLGPVDRFSRDVSGIGDFNNDGIDDVLIGNDQAQSGTGESYVVFGNAAPLALGSDSLLIEQLEDDSDPQGSRLGFSIAANYLDADPFAGMAIIADQSSPAQGQWQFAMDGSNWQTLPSSLSDTSALVVNDNAALRFLPATNFSGRPGGLTVRLWDGRWRQPGNAVDITNAVGALGGFSNNQNLLNVTVDIQPVNDLPSFTALAPPVVNEDPGGVTVSNWSAFDPGPGETEQLVLAYQVANISNPGLFSILPTIDALGNLVYDPRADVSGSSSFEVRVLDSGGNQNGGVNASAFQTFNITVNPVNDAPQLLAEDPPKVVADSGMQTVNQWATFNAGAADELNQFVQIDVTNIDNETLFAATPSVDGQGNLMYTPAPGASGLSRFTVQARDNGGTENGGQDLSTVQEFVIQVLTDELFINSFEQP